MNPLLLRLANVLVGIAYALLFLWLYESYISVQWAYLLLVYFPLSHGTVVKMILLVGAVSASLPLRLERPSSLFLWFLYAFVLVPSVVVTYCVTSEPHRYDPPLFAMAAVFVTAGWVCSRALPSSVPLPEPPKAVVVAFFAAWVAISTALFFRYLPILSLAGIEDVYDQRELARGTNTGIFLDYARTYYAAVFTPGLIAYGLMAKRPLFVGFGLLGCVLGYAIAAEKSALLMPVLIFSIWGARRFKIAYTPVLTGGMVVLTAFCATLTNHTALARYFADLILMRAIAVPGQTLGQYHDYFSVAGYTWWSHVRGISAVVPAPHGLGNDPQWPELGLMVGGAYFGFSRGQNSNANLFVGDGVAAAGWLGVLVIGAVFIVWIRLLDRATVRWSPTFVLLIMTPVVMALTNGHLTTVLLSFGGLFWTLVFLAANARAARKTTGVALTERMSA